MAKSKQKKDSRSNEARVASTGKAIAPTTDPNMDGKQHLAGDDGSLGAVTSDPHGLNLRRLLLAGAVATVAMTVYLSTLYPSVAGGDATEFAFAACQFSVPHPPGYPTFLVVSHAFVRLLPDSWGTPAARANAASAFFASGAAGMTFLAAETITGNEPAALLAAGEYSNRHVPFSLPHHPCHFDEPTTKLDLRDYFLSLVGLFAFGRLVWTHSIQSEVFSLNNLLAAALLYLAACFERCPRDLTAYWGALVCGLAATNQHTLVFYAGPIVLYALVLGRRSLLRPLKLLGLVASVVAGMLPYLVLVWRSSESLPGSWGDLTTVDGFLTHFLRREYGTFRLFAGAERGDHRFLLGLRAYASSLLADSHAAGAALLLLGALLTLLRSGPVKQGQRRGVLLPGARITLLCWLLYTVTFHYIANLPIEKELYMGVHARFWMQSHVASHQVLAIGAAGVARVLDTVLTGGRASDQAGASVSTALALAAVAAQIGRHFRAMDQAGNFYVLNYGKELLRPLPKNARMIVKGDLVTNTVRYLQVCEGYRTDVQVVDMSMMTYPWFKKLQAKNVPGITWPGQFYHPHEKEGFSMLAFLAANMQPIDGGTKVREMFMAGGWHPEDPTPHEAFRHVPLGLADRVQAHGAPFDFSKWRKTSRKALPALDMTPPASRGYSGEQWEAVMAGDFFQAVSRRAHELLQHCERNGADVEILREVEKELVKSTSSAPSGEAFRNLGVAQQMLLKTKEATDDLYHAMAESFRKYLEMADPRAPGYESVQEVVRLHDMQTQGSKQIT